MDRERWFVDIGCIELKLRLSTRKRRSRLVRRMSVQSAVAIILSKDVVAFVTTYPVTYS